MQLKGTDYNEIVSIADAFDEIMENFAKHVNGVVTRKLVCETCLNKIQKSQITESNLSELEFLECDEDDSTCSQKHEVPFQTVELLKRLKEEGNFKNFEKIEITNEEIEILSGAVKVRSEDKFNLLARTARHNNFIQIVDYLKTLHMVRIVF